MVVSEFESVRLLLKKFEDILKIDIYIKFYSDNSSSIHSLDCDSFFLDCVNLNDLKNTLNELYIFLKEFESLDFDTTYLILIMKSINKESLKGALTGIKK